MAVAQEHYTNGLALDNPTGVGPDNTNLIVLGCAVKSDEDSRT
jgi:hypothetical protein